MSSSYLGMQSKKVKKLVIKDKYRVVCPVMDLKSFQNGLENI
jgi:hypothetical protein